MSGNFTPRGWINGEVWDAAAVIDVETRLGNQVNAKASDGDLATHAASQPAHGGDLAGTARPPLGHGSSHASGGADPVSVTTGMVQDAAITFAKVNADVPIIPIGSIVAFAGINLPANGRWVWADGGLIDRTTYSAFMSAVGHAYNGGVDPGGNSVRVPDKRGRLSVGAVSMPGGGTGGAAPGRSQAARGTNGGASTVQLLAAESGLPDHVHVPKQYQFAEWRPGDAFGPGPGAAILPQFADTTTGSTTTQNAAQAHQNMPPFEADNYIVRVL